MLKIKIPVKVNMIKTEKNTIVKVWDKPCRINNECPFYKKNTNYPNEYKKDV